MHFIWRLIIVIVLLMLLANLALWVGGAIIDECTGVCDFIKDLAYWMSGQWLFN